MEEYRIHRHILCVDLKSFYASVECALRGLDPFNTPLIVADESRGGGSVVLAVSPFLKAHGFKNRARLHEVPAFPNMIIAKPRMREYLRFSRDIISIYLRYVSHEDLHIYSIDEAFLDVTSYLSYYQCDAPSLARRILDEILRETHIPATCGIGDNLLLSKLALDLYSKRAPDGLAEMRYADVPNMLWPIRPLSAMWGIGSRMEHRLNLMNIFTVYDLAHSSIKTLKRLFGVIGEELYYHAHGIDQAIISEKCGYKASMKSVGLGQTLFKDYDATMIFQVLLEMSDEVAEKLRFVRKRAKTLHLSIGYSKASGGGFSRQCSFEHPTDDVDDLFKATLDIFLKHHDETLIRRVSIRATNLVDAQPLYQVSFFEDVVRQTKRAKLWTAVDQVRDKYGKTACVRLSSLLEDGTMIERSSLVGGHHG